MKRTILATAITVTLSSTVFATGNDLYQKHCASCHHPERYGISGPPLMPEYLGRRKPAELKNIILNGLTATNMPAFKDAMTPEEAGELVSFITSPIERPVWTLDGISNSRSMSAPYKGAKKSKYDMTNFFMIVEGGAGKVHFMDGDTFNLLGNIKVGPIHGGPKFDKKLRYAYLAARDGWVIKYDVISLREVGRIRAGISSRNIAISKDSKYLAVANLLPENLVIIDTATLKPVKVLSDEGAMGSVYSLRNRGEFVASLRDRPEILIINDKTLKTRKIKIDQPFTDFFIEPSERYLIGTSRDGNRVTVVDTEKGAVVKELPVGSGMPHLASAAIWKDGGKTFAAFPVLGRPLVAVMEMYSWEIKKEITTKGAGFFARTHDDIPDIWVDTNTETIQLIDKKTLEVRGEIVPQPGKKSMHIEFTKSGRVALISVWEDEGAVNFYDTKTLELVKSIPFKKPVGKYNATNKKF